MTKKDFFTLIDRCLAGKANESEQVLLEVYYERLANMDHEQQEIEKIADLKERIWSEVHAGMKGNSKGIPVQRFHRRPSMWPWAAACLAFLMVAGLGAWLYTFNSNNHQGIEVVEDVAPGGNKAMLKRGDGSTILLDEVANGLLYSEASVEVKKAKDSLLVFEHKGQVGNETAPVGMNEIIVPRGGQYRLVLPDGSRVWLNASTSLRFPSRFVGSSRNIELDGEAYFEIKKDARHPFVVQGKAMQVRVLGTSFNMRHYTDSPVSKVTLVHGAVKVVNGAGYEQALIPGQQAYYSSLKERANILMVDTEQETAWMQGLFAFTGAGIEEIMDKFSKWYDVKVNYVGAKPNILFTGSIPMQLNLSTALSFLEDAGGVHFKVYKDKVDVMANMKKD